MRLLKQAQQRTMNLELIKIVDKRRFYVKRRRNGKLLLTNISTSSFPEAAELVAEPDEEDADDDVCCREDLECRDAVDE